MKFHIAFTFLLAVSCIYYEEIEEKNFKAEDVINENLGSSRCLPTNSEMKDFIDKNNINYNGGTNYDKKVKFIAGDCNPVVLIPGIYSTKLKVKINCKNIIRDEKSLYEKIKFYCPADDVCKSNLDTDENRYLWFNLAGQGFSLLRSSNKLNLENDLKASYEVKRNNEEGACLGFFMTMFNDETECPTIGKTNKKICGYSKNIQISFDGGFENDKKEGDCGIKAVKNVLNTGVLPFDYNPSDSNIFGSLVDVLEDLGYEEGFSLAAVPNDFRRFISTNDFAYNALKYHINNMYTLTGKPVVIIAHSFGNLVTLNTLKKEESLKDKIKKWISIAPPFGGATKAVDNFLHTIPDFNFKIKNDIQSKFEEFGQYLMLKSVPTVYELRPNKVFWEYFNSEENKDFAEAIRERIELEKECRDKTCNTLYIENKSIKFNKLFKDYFPSLTLDECKYESTVGGNQNAKNKKCMSELFNIVDCPSFVKLSSEQETYNIESFCNNKGDNLYYIANCGQIKDSKCIDSILPEVPNVFDYFYPTLENFKKKFREKFNYDISNSYFNTKEEHKETIQKMMEHHDSINSIKELPIPPVDIDIVYGSFNPTMAAEFVRDNDYLAPLYIEEKGGDGTVPTWSSLMTGLKWIYEKEKNKLSQNIRLVEYCSRLSSSSLNLKNFIPISCQCLEGNTYKGNTKEDLESYSHQKMLTDTFLFNYITDEITKDDKNINNRKIAIEKYSLKKDHKKECNSQLYSYINKNNQCKELTISAEDYESGNFCGRQGYTSAEGYSCCSIHVYGTNNKDGSELNNYYCRPIKNNKDYKNYYIDELKALRRFENDQTIDKVDFDCFCPYLILFKRFLLLLLFLI